MTGGEDITIWRWDYKHDEDYFVEALDHEIGHKIDTTMGGGKRYSSMGDWKAAMQSDLSASGKKSFSTYGENSETEDFAESIRYYIKDKKSFSSTMPNRGKIIDDIVNGRIAAP
jgi:hypothetical protein